MLKHFQEEGPSTLRHRRLGPATDMARWERVTSALDRLLDRDRTWTAPQHSPELNDIEPLFRNVKHHELAERRYTCVPALEVAVDDAVTDVEARIVARRQHQLRLAA